MQNSSAARAVDVGTVIADTYTIEALIGRGGMGSVFLATHNRLPGKKVAIKLLHADLVDDEVLARFKREAQIATQLDHPNIVRVDDFITLPDGTPCMLLEYLQGETLAQKLRSGPLDLEHALSIVRQIGSALSAAHRAGIVHRDLKPQNIFLVPTEHDGHAIEVAKVLDFGISKIRGSQTVKTQESSLLGTPQYMAPEQATGQHTQVDERTDIFAFGAIVYEMLCGQPAFQGASIPEVVFKVVYEQPIPLATLATMVPTSVTDAIEHAMQKSADKRYANVNLFIEALTGQPISQFRIKKVSLPPATQPLADGTKNDAFAATVGSGDHKDAIKPLTPPPMPPVVNAMDATVDSQSRKPTPHVLDTLVAPPPPSIAATTATAPAPPHRSGMLVPAIIVGCLAIAGAIVFLAMKSSSSSDKPAPPPVAVVDPKPPTPPPPVKDVVVPAVTIDAGVAGVAVVAVVDAAAAVVAVAPVDAGAAKIVPVAPPPPDTKTYPDDAEAKSMLAEAESKYVAGDCDTAKHHALLVARKAKDAISHVVRSDAHAILGACACLANDQGEANTQYRGVFDATAASRRFTKVCKDAGYTLSRQ